MGYGEMTCEQFIAFLDEYQDGAVLPEARAELDAHVSRCADCERYAESYRSTIELARTAWNDADEASAAEVPEALVRAILTAQRRPKS